MSRGWFCVGLAAVLATFLSACPCQRCGEDARCNLGGQKTVGKAPPDGTELWCERDGAKEGFYGKWHDNGKPSIEGSYKAGKKQGTWFEYYEDGQVKTEQEFYDDQKEGPYARYDEGGQKLAEGAYSGGKEDGRWTLYHKNGKKSEEGDYLDGDKTGQWVYWTTGGKVERKVTYKNGVEKSVIEGEGPPSDLAGGEDKLVAQDPGGEGGRPDSRCRDGGVLFGLEPPAGAELWCEKDKRKHGLYKKWWPDGSPWIEGDYTEGRESGLWTEWYDDGQKTSRGTYLRGKKHGEWTYYYANGQPRTRGMYNRDTQVGPWKEWHEDGREKNDTQYGGELPTELPSVIPGGAPALPPAVPGDAPSLPPSDLALPPSDAKPGEGADAPK